MSTDADTPKDPETSSSERTAVPHLWRQELSPPSSSVVVDDDAATRASSQRRRKIFRILCVMLALAGVIVGLLSWLRPLPQPDFFPVWVANYQSPLIPVPAGSSPDRNAIRAGDYFPRTNPDDYVNQERAFLVKELSDLETVPDGEAVVVYLSAFAAGGSAPDKDGKAISQVFVFPGDVNPDVSTSKLSLRVVLESLRRCPVGRKLLILDIMRPLAMRAEPGVPPGRLSVLADDVAWRIEADLQAVEDPNRLVVCSCSPGQVSLFSEALNRSVFSYYLEMGLRGHADGYGPYGKHWGRIDILELYYYVRDRVDHWAWRNRGIRQTPVMHGLGDNFQLISLDHGQPVPTPEIPAIPSYPKSIQADFALLDQWRAMEGSRLQPRTIRQLEAFCLFEDLAWRGGLSSESIRNNRLPYIELIQKQFKAGGKAVTLANPRSLALAYAQGQVPDDTVVEAVQKLAVQAKTQTKNMTPAKAAPVLQKLSDGFFKKNKDVDHFSLAWAVFQQAVDESQPTPMMIGFLNGLLRAAINEPRYIETLCLQQLADRAANAPKGNWPTSMVRRLLSVTAKGEQAACRRRALIWLKPLIEEADLARHDGAYLFWAQEYASRQSTERLLQRAEDQYNTVMVLSDALEAALQTRDEAFTFLPGYIAFLDRRPAKDKIWFATIEAAISLDQSLLTPAKQDGLTVSFLRTKSDEWQQKTQAVQEYLNQLQEPFSEASQNRLLDHMDRPDVDVAVLTEVEAVLSTAYLPIKQRVTLWKAGRKLARQLAETSAKVDEKAHLKPESILSDLDRQHLIRNVTEKAQRRARMAIALWRLGGMSAKDYKPAEQALNAYVKDSSVEKLDILAKAVRQTWADVLPARLATMTNLWDQRRIGWIYPPFDSSEILDELSTDPGLRIERQQAQALWSWLANRYRYWGNDLANGFYLEAAREYAQQAQYTFPQTERLLLSVPPTLPRVTPTTPTASFPIHLSLLGGNTDKVPVQLAISAPPGDWLEITPQIQGAVQNRKGPWQITLEGDARPISRTVYIKLALQPGAVNAGMKLPQGFVVSATVGDRTYHLKVPLTVLPAGDRPEILLSTNPKKPTLPLGSLRLRPIQKALPVYVYLKNPTNNKYALNIDLIDNSDQVLGQIQKFALMPGEIKRVPFKAAPPPAPSASAPKPTTPAPAPASKQLPALAGPLLIRITDTADSSKVYDRRQVDVDIGMPREYIDIADIVFQPTQKGNPNQLTVKLKESVPVPGPAVPAELILPPKRIPGFISAKQGTFRGQITPDGTLTLFAQNILLEGGAAPTGYIYLNVDEYPRAFIFRTTFSRTGDATTPQPDYQPALRIQADTVAAAGNKNQVTLEVDNAPAGATLQLALGVVKDNVFVPDLIKRFPTPRDRRVGFKAGGPNGSLLFDASLRDWSVPLDTKLIIGPRLLRARLKSSTGEIIREVSQKIILANSPPSGVQIVGAPKEIVKGMPLQLQALGFDKAAGIKKVQFFIGKPVEDKLPPKTPTIPASPTNAAKTTWAALVPLPPTALGPTAISVEFTNNAGLSAFATTTVNVVDKIVPKAGKITGTVVEGNRPQPGLVVVLEDPKAPKGKTKAIAKTKTGKDGTFTFDNVKPGSYDLTTSKPIASRSAKMTVIVKPGQTVKVMLSLML